ncbi:MAG TPA: TadE family protein [Candidatus Dormibacteraeota bacterium]|nr:TadE family protein [Candidatus Dormibacteraeota bacterium]
MKRPYQQLGQTLVEFALVAPVLLLVIGASVDLGRGVLLNNLLSGASRETARLAALEYSSGSNTLPPACSALATPCSRTSAVQGAHLLDSLGVSVVYADSTTIGAAPWYGAYAANADPTQPGTITLTGGTTTNTVYVFIYEIDQQSPNPSPRWSCPTAGCTAANGSAVRTSGRQLVVVDLKLKWQPVLATFLGIPAVITFDSQSVDRIEF